MSSASVPMPMKRPTHFFALRIEDPTVIEAVHDRQSRIIAANPDLATCLIDPRKLHVTMGLLHLPSADDVELAKPIVHNVAAQTESIQCHCPGLATFGSNVLFARVMEVKDHANKLEMLAALIAREIEQIPQLHFPQPRFEPHATICKTSKWRPARNSRKRRPSIQPFVYRDLLDIPLSNGSFLFSNLDLLQM
eukprot:CAMPEP_0197338604 /NCGR_PEP_ID=MMETSP0892-20130614/41580_1 /TAXON_ID=44058 ORGANISM="Aureoumbra lagunensis, Strain CCMP1510" /NCGR_SAMPLE_ID=MMETSP0892 /ASSEMBLY_ACC=CAM_ASM_000538 /LENGTH=192 /DNA_ID=CAMNT_0042842159 /DNA_START=89 /DNA_END=664 /DNA_ORIENTATION=-